MCESKSKKDLIVIGAGDFGREVAWLVSRINEEAPQWNFLGFVDDGVSETFVDGYPVLGNIDWLKQYKEDVFVTCAIGVGCIRNEIWNRLQGCSNLHAATLIDPAVIIGRDSEIGEGSILCAGSIIAITAKLGFNCIVNLNCTIGHDAVLEDCCTMHPGGNISGRVHIGRCSDLGTGTVVIPGKKVAAYSILGAGTVVSKDLIESGTYVGVPAKKIK